MMGNFECYSFCRYAVIDSSGVVLAFGEKRKNLANSIFAGDVRLRILSKKTNLYFEAKKIRGRSCLVLWWAKTRLKAPWTKVTREGRFLSLRGGETLKNKSCIRFKNIIKKLRKYMLRFLRGELKYLISRKNVCLKYVGVPELYNSAITIYDNHYNVLSELVMIVNRHLKFDKIETDKSKSRENLKIFSKSGCKRHSPPDNVICKPSISRN